METIERKAPILFEKKENCCGCGACLNICPKRAISMKEDECGFLYPQIDEAVCVACNLCRSVCAFQNTEEKHSPLETYAAISRDTEQRHASASGGIFAALANKVIAEGGVAFGAAFENDWSVRHIVAQSVSDLCRLQGSKYTQSNIGDSYTEVKQYLKKGGKVIFSGTPCQIAGLYGYLGKDDDNLLTVDIICHGVPNNRMLQDYIRLLEKKNDGKVTAFTFRDKNSGWGINGSLEINNQKKVKLWQSASSYLYYFSKGWIYRESCYKCKYACLHRPADITLGDYWGIERAHPEYLGKSGWNEAEGISVVVANTEKGKRFMKSSDDFIESQMSDFHKASAGNAQLKAPSDSGKREELLDEYKADGWSALEQRFNKHIGWRRYKSQIKSMIPVSVKRMIKSRKGID